MKKRENKKEEIKNQIEKNTQKNKKNQKKEFSKIELFVIVSLTCIVSFCFGFLIKRKSNTEKLSSYEKELISNYRYIVNEYYTEIDPRNLTSYGIKGMIEYIRKSDPYASYIDTDYSDEFNFEVSGWYKGIGIQITTNENSETYIANIFKNSPAELAGLQINDKIIAINDEDVTLKSLEEIKKIVENQKDKQFKIKIRRTENEIEFLLKNGIVEMENVSTEIYEKNNKKIGYIKVKSFTNNLPNIFRNELETIEQKNINSLIIDLRSNSGGQLESVVNVVSMFLDKSNIIYHFKTKDKITAYNSISDEKRDYPIVVLTNNLTASAAELMTAALKEKYGAVIIGSKTYGKGTAQEIMTLDNGAKYKFTINEWLTANGNSINEIGIEPNIKVENNEEYYTNPTIENDKQLDEALKYLSEK